MYIDFGRDKPFKECNNRIDAYSHPRGIDDSFIYTSTDIYVIPSSSDNKRSTQFDLGKKLIDEAGTPNTIIHLGSLFDGTIIGNTKTIGPGMYDVVYDLCQEEILDSEDGLMEDALEVKWIKNFQSTGLDVWKSDKVERLKASAEKTAAALLALKILWKTVIIFGAIKQLANPSAVVEEFKKSSIVQKIIFGLVDATDTLDAIDILVGAEDNVFTVNFLDQLMRTFMGMAADPPNTNYQDLNKLSLVRPISNINQDSMSNNFVELGTEIQKENSLGSSLLSTFESYQGAVLNDDGNWALAHLKQAQDYIILLDKQMIKTNKKISELNNIITSTDDFNNTVLLINKLYDFANVGFDANFTRDLKNLNLTDREIQKSKDFIKREFNIDNQDFIKNLNTFLSH